jgi:hypothetical protein
MPESQSQCPDIPSQFCCTLKEKQSHARFDHAGFEKRRFRQHFGRRREICFERAEASGKRVKELSVGYPVEFELQYGFERPCAVNVRRLERDAEPNVQQHRVTRR